MVGATLCTHDSTKVAAADPDGAQAATVAVAKQPHAYATPPSSRTQPP
ncbi:MAG: hypothetical protein M5U28_14555 [Sandaracinaceae bacterium]|nr:hypothetical protein [Sandaracinaceae bacterium]